jgi:hypothetical protein
MKFCVTIKSARGSINTQLILFIYSLLIGSKRIFSLTHSPHFVGLISYNMNGHGIIKRERIICTIIKIIMENSSNKNNELNYPCQYFFMSYSHDCHEAVQNTIIL